MYETILELKNNGTLKDLIRNGLISPKVLTYLEIYMWVDARQKVTGKRISEIVIDAEVSFNLGKTTVWKAIKIMRNND